MRGFKNIGPALLAVAMLGVCALPTWGQPGPEIPEDRPAPWHVTSFVEDANLEGSAVFVIDFAADGTVWVAASNGLYRYDGYRWNRYTTAHGLPSDYVRCVTVTRDGELWVGTDRGAGVFDGKIFDPRGSQGRLVGPSVRRIVEDPGGTLWFACDQWPPSDVPAGLTRYRDGTWKSWRAEDGLPSDYVSDVFRDGQGRHFILTRRGLARFETDEILRRPIEEAGLEECQDYIWSMVETPAGDLVVATGEWFCFQKDGGWHRLPNDSPRINLSQLTTTRDGTVLACTSEPQAQFVEWKNHRIVPIWRSQLDTRGGVQYIAESPDGAVWVGGPNLLARWERLGSEWRSFDGLPYPQLRDADGGVWFAEQDRVLCLKNGGWSNVRGASGPLVRDSSRGVWMHTANGLALWRDDELAHFSEDVIGVDNPRTPRVDGSGRLTVIGTGRDGRDCTARFDGQAWAVHDLGDITPTETVILGTPDVGRGMWYVLNDSDTELYRLLRVDGATAIEVPLPLEARRYWLPRVHGDRSGRLWLYGWMGLYQMDLDADPAAWQPMTELPGKQVVSVVELRDDVWFSYLGSTGGSGGVTRLRDGTWTHFPIVARYLTSREGEDMLFFAHSRGVSVVEADSEQAPSVLALPTPTWAEAIVPGPQDDFWVGSADRLFHYRPDGIPPETLIVHGERDIRHGEDLVLQVRGVERFRAAAGPGIFNVAVRLDDQSWSAFRPLSDGRVTIGNLATGDHVVRVRVQDQGRDVDPTPAEWRFRLHPVPLQDRSWFRPVAIGITLIVLLLVGLIVAVRRRELGERRKTQALEHKILGISEREQRRIGMDLHDGIGQRLTSISFQFEALRSTLERGDGSSPARMKEIGSAVRETIAETKVLAQALYPAEIDRRDLEAALGNLLASAIPGFDGRCTYRYSWSPADLDREDAVNVYRMVQEALNNAMRHAGATTINVELKRNGEKWVIEVRDDGCGFDTARGTPGLGLQIMRYRANLVGGQLTIDSTPGAGTTIRCEVPVSTP